MKKVLLLLLSVFTLSGCATKIPLKNEFYNTKKVGVIIDVERIGIFRKGPQGIIDYAFTPGLRFEKPLNAIESKIDFKQSLEKEIMHILENNQKAYQLIDENLVGFKEFKRTNSYKKYAKKDFTSLKEKYKVDELIVIKAKHGMMISYFGFIELEKCGFSQINAMVVDLIDNSIIHMNQWESISLIKGNWKKGEDYMNLKEAINKSIDHSFKKLRINFLYEKVQNTNNNAGVNMLNESKAAAMEENTVENIEDNSVYDVVYFKNGKILQGTIIEKTKDGFVKLKLVKGNVVFVSEAQILKINYASQ